MDNCVQASDVQELVDIFDLVSENKVDLKRCKELREDYDYIMELAEELDNELEYYPVNFVETENGSDYGWYYVAGQSFIGDIPRDISMEQLNEPDYWYVGQLDEENKPSGFGAIMTPDMFSGYLNCCYIGEFEKGYYNGVGLILYDVSGTIIQFAADLGQYKDGKENGYVYYISNFLNGTEISFAQGSYKDGELINKKHMLQVTGDYDESSGSYLWKEEEVAVK